MAQDKTYYAWGNKTPKVFRKTPKQLRLIDGEGKVTVLKPKPYFNNLNATLHTYTFTNGTTRQWFFKGDNQYGVFGREKTVEDYAKTMKKVGREVVTWDEFGFVTHPDDKVFHRDRIVYAHKWAVAWDGGRHRHAVSYDGVCFGERAGIRPPPYLPVHRTYVVSQTWVKWGGLEVLLDDGLKRWHTYDIGDSRVEHVAPRKFLRLDDFRASPAPNPFDDPFDPALKAMRDKRNEMNEDIARAVFHPERVERMMTAYGEDWMEHV